MHVSKQAAVLAGTRAQASAANAMGAAAHTSSWCTHRSSFSTTLGTDVAGARCVFHGMHAGRHQVFNDARAQHRFNEARRSRHASHVHFRVVAATNHDFGVAACLHAQVRAAAAITATSIAHVRLCVCGCM